MTGICTALALLLALLHLTWSYPSGAPVGTCSSLVPIHSGASAQNNPSPYEVIPGKMSIAPGSKMTLVIKSATDASFKGFILQARDGKGSDSALGVFTELPTSTKSLTCPGGYTNSANTATHSNATLRKSLQFEWEAPDFYEGSVVFYATVVQDFSTFWANVKSNPITISKRAADNSSQSSGISTTREPVMSTITNPPFIPTQPTRKASVRSNIFYDGCSDRKTCFGDSADCIENRDCKAAVSVEFKVSTYEFALTGKVEGYVAVGLSRDAKMGEDSVVECARSPPGSSTVKAFMSWNAGTSNRRLANQDGITLKNSSYIDGTIYCLFVRDTITTVENEEFNLEKDMYHLLIAAGSNVRENNVLPHDLARAAKEKRFLSDTGIIAAASNLLLRLHGAFMIGAWIGAAGIGILLARYYKQTWVGSQFCGKDQWFAWHRMFMLLTWALTIAAFVIIFVELKAWSEATDNPHAILGVVTTALAFLQPFGAAFRPHPDSRRRPLFNWLHWLVGNVAHILGIVTIFFAIRLNKAELPLWMDWILVGYVAFHVAVHLILSIASIVSERNNGKRVNSFPMKEMTSSRSPLHSPERKQDSPHACFRKFMLALYIIVILLVVAALIIITVCAPIEKSFEKFQNMIMQSRNSSDSN